MKIDLIKITLTDDSMDLMLNERLKLNEKSKLLIEECYDKIIKTLGQDKIFMNYFFKMEG